MVFALAGDSTMTSCIHAPVQIVSHVHARV
jgi:hypothetical protein